MDIRKGSLENMELNTEFWKGKKVLITGHTGFKGGWLSLWLQHLGAELIGISLAPPTTPNFYEQVKIAAGMISLRGDIRDGEAIKQIFQAHQPEIVFHLAAQPLVRYSYRKPVETFETNVMGTLHVLEAIRHVGSVRAALMVSTDKCYKNNEWEWGYRENEPMGGDDPYSSSKAAAELLIASYRKSYYPISKTKTTYTAIASVRAGNVIGGGDWAEDRLIPDILRALSCSEQIFIRNPNSIRPWQHVLEPLVGYIKLAEHLTTTGGQFAQAWNFGPLEDDVKPVKWIVQKMVDLWGEGASWKHVADSQLHEAILLTLDCSKAHANLNWWPTWRLNKALKMVVDWQRTANSGEDIRSLSFEQIDNYMNDMASK